MVDPLPVIRDRAVQVSVPHKCGGCQRNDQRSGDEAAKVTVYKVLDIIKET
jgi:hypothetical protein